MAPVQPWSAAGAEKPIVTGFPGASELLEDGAATRSLAEFPSSPLPVQPLRTTPAPIAAPPNRKPRRPRARLICRSLLMMFLSPVRAAEVAVLEGRPGSSLG